MVITPTTDLEQFKGCRVEIAGRYARIHSIRHGAEATLCADALHGGVWGDMAVEPSDGDRGGGTAFYFDYGTTINHA